jgi:hypothetical protein
MYHTNGVNTLHCLLGRDRLVVLEKFDAELVVDMGQTSARGDPADRSRVDGGSVDRIRESQARAVQSPQNGGVRRRNPT